MPLVDKTARKLSFLIGLLLFLALVFGVSKNRAQLLKSLRSLNLVLVPIGTIASKVTVTPNRHRLMPYRFEVDYRYSFEEQGYTSIVYETDYQGDLSYEKALARSHNLTHVWVDPQAPHRSQLVRPSTLIGLAGLGLCILSLFLLLAAWQGLCGRGWLYRKIQTSWRRWPSLYSMALGVFLLGKGVGFFTPYIEAIKTRNWTQGTCTIEISEIRLSPTQRGSFLQVLHHREWHGRKLPSSRIDFEPLFQPRAKLAKKRALYSAGSSQFCWFEAHQPAVLSREAKFELPLFLMFFGGAFLIGFSRKILDPIFSTTRSFTPGSAPLFYALTVALTAFTGLLGWEILKKVATTEIESILGLVWIAVPLILLNLEFLAKIERRYSV